MPVCYGGCNLGRRGPRLRARVALAAGLLVLAGCGGDDADTGDDGNTASIAITDNNPAGAGSMAGGDAGVTVVDDSTATATTPATPFRLGDRFGWCDNVQRRWDAQVRYRAEVEAAALAYEAAVSVYEAASDDLDRAEAQEPLDRALADYESAKRDYAKTRWIVAGLILGDVSRLSAAYDYGDDPTLQVAIDRAFEAFSSSAGADTLAAFDAAHQATETVELVRGIERSGGDEPVKVVEAPEPEPAVFDSSQGWLMAIEAVREALEAAADAKDASDAAAAATNASRRAVGDADDAASQLYFAARRDGDWEILIGDFEAQLAAARSGMQAAEDFTAEAYEAVAAAEAAAEAARAAEEAAAAARALANQSGATEGEQAYRDMPTKAPQARIDARLWANTAAVSASLTSRDVINATQAAQKAAWYVARISAEIDADGVAAFRQSLQHSCR